MGSFRIIEAINIASEGGAGFGDIVISTQIDLLIFDCAPKPLDEDIIPPSTLVIHADGDLVFQK